MKPTPASTFKKHVCFLMTSLLLLCSSPFAQGTSPDGFDEPVTTDTPIDGGLALLLAAGAGYGLKRYRNGRKYAKREE